MIPDRTRKDLYPYWECFQDQKGLVLFQKSYEVPNDVIISPVEGNQIQFSYEHVTVPFEGDHQRRTLVSDAQRLEVDTPPVQAHAMPVERELISHHSLGNKASF